MGTEKNTGAGTKKKPQDEPRRCAYCGSEASLVWVHGHGQCSSCGINVQECCQGENCQMD